VLPRKDFGRRWHAAADPLGAYRRDGADELADIGPRRGLLHTAFGGPGHAKVEDLGLLARGFDVGVLRSASC